MLRQTILPLCLLMTLGLATAAHAGDRPPPPPRQDDQDDESAPPPYAGYDVGYDYAIAHDHPDVDPYYTYQGPAPTDPRAREQTGLRDGDLPIKPRTDYDAGVTLYGEGYGYGSGDGYGDDSCGCAHYRRRYNVYYNDFGIRGASYSGYSHHGRDDYGRGYSDR